MFVEISRYSVNNRFSCFSNQSINQSCRFFCSNFLHLINNRFSFCSSTSNNFYNNHFSETLKHRLLKKKIIYISNHLFQINKQSFKISNKKFKLRFVSFRFCFSDLFVSTTFNKFVTTINKFVSMKFLMSRLKRFQNTCVRFFTFSQSIFSTKMNLLHYNNDTKTNNMKKWKTTINANLLHDQINSFFS